jgi:hypothetical protein
MFSIFDTAHPFLPMLLGYFSVHAETLKNWLGAFQRLLRSWFTFVITSNRTNQLSADRGMKAESSPTNCS